MDINIICVKCKHLNTNGFWTKCKAFPKGIPDEILLGKNNHSKPLKDQDNDIVFEEIK